MTTKLHSRRTYLALDCTAARGLGMKATLLLLAALLLAPLARLAAAEPKPNVLLILSDDHSYPHVGCTVSESGKLGHVTSQAARISGDHRTGLGGRRSVREAATDDFSPQAALWPAPSYGWRVGSSTAA